MKHLSWTLLLIAATLTACSSDDDNEPQNPAATTTQVVPQPETRLMYVDVSETPLTDEAEARQEGTTRAAITETATLRAFSMNYMENKYPFTKDDVDGWSTNSWPSGVENNQSIDFYAYTGGRFIYNGGNPYLSFPSEEQASEQHDLLVAEHKDISYNTSSSGHVSLHFSHACAAVNFRIGQSSTLNDKHATFTSIAITGIYNQGEYHYNNPPDTPPSWTGVTGNATYTLESASSIEIPVSTTDSNKGARELACGYLFMIPQDHNVTIRIGYTLGGESKTADITLPAKWQAGYQYTVNIRLGTNTIK